MSWTSDTKGFLNIKNGNYLIYNRFLMFFFIIYRLAIPVREKHLCDGLQGLYNRDPLL